MEIRFIRPVKRGKRVCGWTSLLLLNGADTQDTGAGIVTEKLVGSPFNVSLYSNETKIYTSPGIPSYLEIDKHTDRQTSKQRERGRQAGRLDRQTYIHTGR